MSIVVSLSLATICFANQCFPVLVGKSTPVGEYQMFQARVEAPGYGGDVVVFKEVKGEAPFAIHRVWTRIPTQRRLEKLAGPVEGRKGVTGGCINVDFWVYEKIVEKHLNEPLTIVP